MAAACWPDRTLQATIMCGLRPKKKKIETEKEKKRMVCQAQKNFTLFNLSEKCNCFISAAGSETVKDFGGN